MSKQVKIPDYTRPSWSCSINGVKYSYPAGTVQEVPDAVASFIESLRVALQKKEEITPPLGGTFDPKIVCTATGCPISLKDSASHGLMGLKIYGKTTQNGEPSPDAPTALESVGDDGRITVSIGAQTVSIATPNGLPGIPVATGGNYTDANGQKWICDEVDFEKGVYVRRIERYTLAVADMNGTENYPGWANGGVAKYFPGASNAIGRYGAVAICNIERNPGENVHINTKDGKDVLMIPNPDGMKQSQWKTQYPELVFELIVSIPAPEQITLSREKLTTYAAMHTNYPNTTISNDGGADMEVKYVADTKLYIDEKFALMNT